MSEIATLKTRILQYLSFKGISKYECYQKTGITNGVLSKKEGLSEDNLLRFISYYGDISPEWLLTGKGGMLSETSEDSENILHSKTPKNVYKENVDNFVDSFVDIQKLRKTSTNDTPSNSTSDAGVPEGSEKYFAYENSEKHGQTVCPEICPEFCPNSKTPKNMDKLGENILPSKLRKTPHFDGVTPEANATPITVTVDTSNYEVIPMVDVDAAAGSGAYNEGYIEQKDVIRMPQSMFHRKGVRQCIQVAGESMFPTLDDGGYIINRLLDPSEWVSVKSGRVYVITTREGITYVKRAENRLRTEGLIVCNSDNPDKMAFKPFSVRENEIHNIWEVEWYFNSNIPDVLSFGNDRITNIEDSIKELRGAVRDIKVMVLEGKK